MSEGRAAPVARPLIYGINSDHAFDCLEGAQLIQVAVGANEVILRFSDDKSSRRRSYA